MISQKQGATQSLPLGKHETPTPEAEAVALSRSSSSRPQPWPRGKLGRRRPLLGCSGSVRGVRLVGFSETLTSHVTLCFCSSAPHSKAASVSERAPSPRLSPGAGGRPVAVPSTATKGALLGTSLRPTIPFRGCAEKAFYNIYASRPVIFFLLLTPDMGRQTLPPLRWLWGGHGRGSHYLGKPGKRNF